MAGVTSPIQEIKASLDCGRETPQTVAEKALARANSNPGKNVYLSLDRQKAMEAAIACEKNFASLPKPPLYGLPISLKDCFDLAGYPTTCGSRYYAEQNGIAVSDSAVAKRLRAQGAVITGKTHMQQLAYGITGENQDYGDCLQPVNAALLTGGSSSGAAASIQEGSAIAAVGTDTGGSLRLPAALCGLASYRASWTVAQELGLWGGAMHLAPSFDTLGCIFSDLRDAPILGEGLLGLQPAADVETRALVGMAINPFLEDCEAAVLEGFAEWQTTLRGLGANLLPLDLDFWEEASSLFGMIQADEAAKLHAENTNGDFSPFEPRIAERLTWGASLPEARIALQRKGHKAFRQRMDTLLQTYEYLIVPCSPIARLMAGADHQESRVRILRYTTPMSLAGVPVITLPCRNGAGVQLVAACGADARLLAYAARLGTALAKEVRASRACSC